jgi:hypothetical protein
MLIFRHKPSIVILLIATTASIVTVGCLGGGVSPIHAEPGLAGQVFDASTHKGLPGATVQIQGRMAVTNTAGQYSFEPLETGPTVAVVTHEGFADLHQAVTITGQWSSVTGTRQDPVDFELRPQP